jgi:hypothetical protein
MIDAEQIIITKNFHELSPAEKKAVKTYAENENEYNQIKAFLLATRESFQQQKINPSDQLKQAVYSELYKSPSQKSTWLNNLLLFLFPPHKKVYQYPSFQLALASLLFLFIFNYLKVNLNDNQMAVQQKKEYIELPTPSKQPLVVEEQLTDSNSFNFNNKSKQQSRNVKSPNKVIIDKTTLKKFEDLNEFEMDEDVIEKTDKLTSTDVVKNKDLNTAGLKETKTLETIVVNEDEIESTSLDYELNNNLPKASANKQTTQAYRSAQQPTLEKKKVETLTFSETPELEQLFFEVK